jgi:hypothetical protein
MHKKSVTTIFHTTLQNERQYKSRVIKQIVIKNIDFSPYQADIVLSSSTMCGRSNEAVLWGGFSFLSPAFASIPRILSATSASDGLFHQVGHSRQDVVPAIPIPTTVITEQNQRWQPVAD